MESHKTSCLEFLTDELLMHLATTGASGNPSVCAVEFLHDDDFTFYWRSDDTSNHSTNLVNNPHGAVAVTALYDDGKGEGVQASGIAQKITDPSLILTLSDHIDRKRNKEVSGDIEKQESGRSYWMFKSERLFYINESVLGYKRVEIPL